MKEYVRLLIVLLVPLLLLLAYSLSDATLMLGGRAVRKVPLQRGLVSLLSHDVLPLSCRTDNDFPLNEGEDVLPMPMYAASASDTVGVCDTVRKHILLFGDSMVEGLALRMSEYARENGHTLYSVCWYGSSTMGWAANTDTLKSMLRWSGADYVFVSLGGNELKVTDLENRRANIRKIMKCLGSRPVVWIAPPSWISKPTITEVIRKEVGEARYFDSTNLTFTRGSDRMHPTFGSASRWMDSIAVWVSSPATAHPIRMDRPSRKYPRNWQHRIIRN